MDTYRPSVPTVRRYPAGFAARLGHRVRQMRLWTLVVAVGLILVSLSGIALASDTRERLAGDEGRANFSVTDPEDSCLTHEIWLSAFVGEHMPLGQAGGPSDVTWVRATDHVIDMCTETEVEYFDGIVVDLPPDQIELERLESASVNNVTVELWSEAGNTLSLTFNLTWTPIGPATPFIYNVGGSEALQVERYVPAEVRGSAVMNEELVIPGQPWFGEISRLTQIGRPTTVSPRDSNPPIASPEAARTVGERINLLEGDTSFPAGEPFHISHGFAGFVAPDPYRWDFTLEVDGVPVPDSGVVIEQREDELRLGGFRVYNFADGMTGIHIFDGYWYQSCNGSLAECEPGAPPGSLTEVFHVTVEVTFDES